MDNRHIVKLLREITTAYMREPHWGLSDKEFSERSWQKWAVNEIIRHIQTSNLSPIATVDIFAQKMDEFACQNLNTSHMFSVVYDTAMWVMDILFAIDSKEVNR